MKVVIYTEELEPITVVDLPMWAIDAMKDGRKITIPVWNLEPFRTPIQGEPLEVEFPHVVVWAERWERNGRIAHIILTNHEVLALKLRSDVLPGQLAEHQAQFRRGFITALLAGLSDGRR